MTTLADLLAQARPPTLLLDALAAPPAVCECGNPGATRRWVRPNIRHVHTATEATFCDSREDHTQPRAGYFCDPCEAKVQLGRLWLQANNLHEALNAVLGAVA
jgi:hypothetical protein